MTPAQIRDYAVTASLKNGINPAVTLGIIGRMSSYATKFDRAGKLGLMAVPNKDIADKAAYLANPKAQIDSGVLRLAALKGDGTDLDGMEAYIGDAKAAKKALILGLKTTTEPVTRETMQDLYQLTGSRGNVDNDAASYGYDFYKRPKSEDKTGIPEDEPKYSQENVPVEQPANTPTPEVAEAGMKAGAMTDEDDGEDEVDLVQAMFDSQGKSTKTPDFVWKQLEAIGAE